MGNRHSSRDIRQESGNRGLSGHQFERNNSSLRQELDSCKRSLEGKRMGLNDLQKQLQKTLEELQDARMVRITLEERSRRQDEMISDYRSKHDAAVQEIAVLTIRMTELQQWTHHMSDDEVRDKMLDFYHRQDSWIKRHFLRPVLKRKTPDQLHDQLCGKPLSRADVICRIHSQVSRTWYELFLRHERIAIRDEQLSESFRSLDREIQKQCPTHAVHHWKSATSIGLFSLHSPTLISSCYSVVTDLVRDIEANLGQISAIKTQERIEELRKLAWELIEFKQRLECQSESHEFGWFDTEHPFKDALMNSFTGNSDPDGIVDYTIFPALGRTSTSKNFTLIEKARVKILSPPGQLYEWHCEKFTQEPYKESTEVSTEEPPEDPIKGLYEEYFDKAQEGPSKKFTEEPTKLLTEDSIEDSNEEPTKELNEDPTEDSTEDSTEESSERLSEGDDDESQKVPSEEPLKDPLEKSPETPLLPPLPPSPNGLSGDFVDLSPLAPKEDCPMEGTEDN